MERENKIMTKHEALILVVILAILSLISMIYTYFFNKDNIILEDLGLITSILFGIFSLFGWVAYIFFFC